MPIVLVTPCLFFARGTTTIIGGMDWFAFGAPLVVGIVGIAIALVERDSVPNAAEETGIDEYDSILWLIIGLIVVVISAVSAITLFSGLCALAAATTIMMINSAPHNDGEQQARVSLLTPLAFLLAVGQGLVIVNIEDEAQLISGGIALGCALAAVCCAAVMIGKQFGIALGGWTAAYAALLSIGLASLTRFGLVLSGAVSDTSPFSAVIAKGLGAYAYETLFFVVVAVYLFVRRLGFESDRAVGTLFLAMSIVITIRRFGQLSSML